MLYITRALFEGEHSGDAHFGIQLTWLHQLNRVVSGHVQTCPDTFWQPYISFYGKYGFLMHIQTSRCKMKICLYQSVKSLSHNKSHHMMTSWKCQILIFYRLSLFLTIVIKTCYLLNRSNSRSIAISMLCWQDSGSILLWSWVKTII